MASMAASRCRDAALGRGARRTSALAVQLLKALEPQLEPLLETPASEAAPMPIIEASPALTGLRKSSESSAD